LAKQCPTEDWHAAVEAVEASIKVVAHLFGDSSIEWAHEAGKLAELSYRVYGSGRCRMSRR